jgi:hypothetical protein
MRFARRDVRDHNAFHKNDHGPSYRPQGASQPVETSKHRLSRDFGSLSIFDFFNSICQHRTFARHKFLWVAEETALRPDRSAQV